MIATARKQELLRLLNELRVEAAVRLARESGLDARELDRLETLAGQYRSTEADFLENLISAEERSRLQSRAVRGLRLLFQGRPEPGAEPRRPNLLFWIGPTFLLIVALGWWWSRPRPAAPSSGNNVNNITTYGKNSDVIVGDGNTLDITKKDEKDTIR
jgi:hypothetical protein